MEYYRRSLPHWHPQGEWLFVTFRLHGSLPMDRGAKTGEDFVRWDRELDAALVGPTWLKEGRVARAVVEAIGEADAEVAAFVVMSNHVHLLLRPGVDLALVMQRLKGLSALRANEILGRTGQFWQRESYDHWVRSGRGQRRVCDYIEQNPVKAGLVGWAGDWPWSSASFFEWGQAKACPT